VISVVKGSVNAKQIKLEFMNLIGASAWRWRARPVADGKFLMRFPSANMVNAWAYRGNICMRNEALIKLEV
jgi:hypothetical protein